MKATDSALGPSRVHEGLVPHRNRFFFLHIPKTAGSSLHKLIEQSAGPYLHLQRPHELHWSPYAIWRKFQGCGGHIRWADAQRNGFLDAFAFTFLRDPVERILSQYSYSQDESHGDLTEAVLARNFELKQLLRYSMGRLGPFWNAQTFMLSGLDSTDATPEAHLESALKNLEALDFVGTLETFQDDCFALIGLLNGEWQGKIPHENQTLKRKGRDGFDQETLAILEESQAMDQVLYLHALKIREKQKAVPLQPSGIMLSGWPSLAKTSGNLEAEITMVKIRTEGGGALSPGAGAEIIVQWTAAKALNNVVLGFRIEDVVGNLISASNTFLLTQRYFSIPPGTSRGVFKFVVNMGAGLYSVDVAIHRDHQDICFVKSAAIFEITTPVIPYREGMVDIVARSFLNLDATGGELTESAARKISLKVESNPQDCVNSNEILLVVSLINHSNYVLSSSETGRFFISYHWLSPDKTVLQHDGLRSRLPHDVWPNESARCPLHVLPPPTAGKWHLQVRLLQEGVRWLEGPGYENAMPSDLMVEYRADGEICFMRNPEFERTDLIIPA